MSFISIGTSLAKLNQHDPFIGSLIGLAVCSLSLWGLLQMLLMEALRRAREQLFED